MVQGIVAGIDWASDVHVACLLDADGAVIARFSFTHDSAAIGSMVRRLRGAGVAGVAIERGDGPGRRGAAGRRPGGGLDGVVSWPRMVRLAASARPAVSWYVQPAARSSTAPLAADASALVRSTALHPTGVPAGTASAAGVKPRSASAGRHATANRPRRRAVTR